MAWHALDKGGKWLIEHHGDALLRLAGVRDIRAWRAVAAEVVQPGQLPDGLLEVLLAGRTAPVYFLLELATKAERRLTEQLVRDMMLVYLQRRVLPEVVAVILRRQGRYRAAADVELCSPLGLSRCQAGWRVVELWTLPTEELLAMNDVGLVPWLPLTNYSGPPAALLQECRDRIDRQARPEERENLLAVTQVMSRLRFTDPELLSLLGGSQVMIESPLIQELMAQRTHQDILRVLEARFGAVSQEIAAELQTIRSIAKADKLVSAAATCPDLASFAAHLRSLARKRGGQHRGKKAST